jgi:hypothetical protein
MVNAALCENVPRLTTLFKGHVILGWHFVVFH